MYFAEPLPCYVRVNLGRADAGMAEQLLDDAQVGAVLQQVGREAVPQHVGSHVARNVGAADTLFDAQPERHRGKRCAAPGEEDTGWRTRGDERGPAGGL